MHQRSLIRLSLLLALVAILWGCEKGGTSGPGEDNSNNLQSLSLTPEPCLATFTKPYKVIDLFDEEQFTVKTGESFILRNFDDFFGTSLYYLFQKGAYDFEVEADSSEQYPFTSNCVEGKTRTHLAVFSNTTVYSDSALTQPLCSLNKGATAPANGPTGFYLVGGFFSSLYHVELGGFSTLCKDSSGGYLRAPEAMVFGASTNLIPINSYESPVD